MPRDQPPSLNEQAFFHAALSSGLRLDSRSPTQFRPLTLTFPSTHGSVELTLGKTKVLATTTAKVTPPYPDRASDGIFTITTELSPQASPAFELGRPSTTEMLLSRSLEKTLRRSGALSTESLCLHAGRAVWTLNLTLHVTSHDGNILDACTLTAVAALLHFRLPVVTIEGESLTVHSVDERVPMPLELLILPVTVTFSICKRQVPDAEGESDEDNVVVLLDATKAEEAFRIASLAVTATAHGEVVQIAELGGAPIEALTLLRCSDMAVEKAKDLSKLIAEKVREDIERREGVLLREGNAEVDRV